VITDLGVFTIDGAGMTLTELAPDVSLDEIRHKTEASFAAHAGLAEQSRHLASGRCGGYEMRSWLKGLDRGNLPRF
jgi:hypothetical protein